MSKHAPSVARCQDGDLIAFPIYSNYGGGYGCAVIAKRCNGTRLKFRSLYMYAFGKIFSRWPTLAEASRFTQDDVVTYVYTSDRRVVEGRWKILGPYPGFRPEEWPLFPKQTIGKFLEFLDDDLIDVLSIDPSIIAPEDREHFNIDYPFIASDADGPEGRLPLALRRPESPFDSFSLTRARINAYQKYLPQFTAALAEARARRDRSDKRRKAYAAKKKQAAPKKRS
jgi:hypothetical protein